MGIKRGTKKKLKTSFLSRIQVLMAAFLLPLLAIVFWLSLSNFFRDSTKCEITEEASESEVNKPVFLDREVYPEASFCYSFSGEQGQNLTVRTNFKIYLIEPDDSVITVSEFYESTLSKEGRYIIRTEPGRTLRPYKIELELNRQLPAPSTVSIESPAPSVLSLENSYNVKNVPPFESDPSLQRIVDETVALIESKGFPTDSLSISLVDLNNTSSYRAYGYYQDENPRFPASVAKLFWIVALYGRYESGSVAEGTISRADEYNMIHESDNEAASRILDKITGTVSGDDLEGTDFADWLKNRQWVNGFFENAGYRRINVTQKNFPIPYLGLEEPQGRDLQIRGDDPSSPERNYLTTFDTARLLYEIETEQAISRSYSRRIKEYLHQDLDPEVWGQKEYNSVEGFFGESLPNNTLLYSKVGWTSSSRQEAAIITNLDEGISYILVIFGDDSSYAQDWQIFPIVSQFIYDQVVSRQNEQE